MLFPSSFQFADDRFKRPEFYIAIFSEQVTHLPQLIYSTIAPQPLIGTEFRPSNGGRLFSS